jgi:hypothetical protein
MKREKEKAFINERRYNLSMCSGDPEIRVLALTDCLEELFLTKTSEPRHTHTHTHTYMFYFVSKHEYATSSLMRCRKSQILEEQRE